MNFSKPITASVATLRLINATGETVVEHPIDKETWELLVNVNHLPSGWYMLIIVADNLTFGEKVLIEE